eukprot:15471464-Alexandrium_andersonii.AAC.1
MARCSRSAPRPGRRRTSTRCVRAPWLLCFRRPERSPLGRTRAGKPWANLPGKQSEVGLGGLTQSPPEPREELAKTCSRRRFQTADMARAAALATVASKPQQ